MNTEWKECDKCTLAEALNKILDMIEKREKIKKTQKEIAEIQEGQLN